MPEGRDHRHHGRRAAHSDRKDRDCQCVGSCHTTCQRRVRSTRLELSGFIRAAHEPGRPPRSPTSWLCHFAVEVDDRQAAIE
jgi:hypothetical protein